MPYNCRSRSFSSSSLGSGLRYPVSSCGFSYPSNLVYSTDLLSPRTCQLGSSLYSGCQNTCAKPIRCQTSCVVSSPCQISCYRQKPSTLCSPCQTTYIGSLGCGSSSTYPLGHGPRSFYPLGCGSSRPPSYEIIGFPSLSSGSGYFCPSYFSSRSFQSSCYRPTCGSGFY
ncbi:keratin-associated protein 13-1-like [Erinaceus europaeus]|uniref:Keratin-associated protein n=1 Tax=Erinaceus europaeus TaxID=9365 RepID=A0A1S3A397_ERIEU|nr:keratin-associated protein 13-1-like [Erinaceus europaeus]